MKQLAILLSLSPDCGGSAEHAIDTLEAVLVNNHAAFVFLYEDGVGFARTDRDVPQGETDPVAKLHRLLGHPNLTCMACITAAERRGVTDKNRHALIEAGGLGQWTDQLAQADRVLQWR